MGRFYETVFFDRPDSQTVLGVQVLAAPPEINGEPIPYEDLLEDIGPIVSLDDAGGLEVALALIADPTSEWNRAGPMEALPPSPGLHLPLSYVDPLLETPVFAAEMSPLEPKSIAKLVAAASTAGVGVAAGLPVVVLVGGGVGFVVIRGLRAVGGALWEGARPEVVDFGADTAASMLNALRRRLGIPRRASR